MIVTSSIVGIAQRARRRLRRILQDADPLTERYDLGEEIGRGGMGVVYRARDRVLQRSVAIKVMMVGRDPTGTAVDRFRREARAASALNHPHIVTVFDLIEYRERLCIVMELVEGADLRTLLEGGPWPPRRAAETVIALARALDRFHAAGFVHRDLKPSNIMIQPDGSPKLLDFGLAALRGEEDQSTSATRKTLPLLTRPGQVLGTPAYMAPEQIRGEKVDHRIDIFSLGCILHQALSGVRPFAGETTGDLLACILRDPAPPLYPAIAGVPEELDAVAARALAKSPADRWPDMAAFADALAAIQWEQGVPHATATPVSLDFDALRELRVAMLSARTPEELESILARVRRVQEAHPDNAEAWMLARTLEKAVAHGARPERMRAPRDIEDLEPGDEVDRARRRSRPAPGRRFAAVVGVASLALVAVVGGLRLGLSTLGGPDDVPSPVPEQAAMEEAPPPWWRDIPASDPASGQPAGEDGSDVGGRPAAAGPPPGLPPPRSSAGGRGVIRSDDGIRLVIGGRVRTARGPLEGARVTVDGYPFSVYTSTAGTFRGTLMDVPDDAPIRLRISSVGYATTTLDVMPGSTGLDSLEVELLPVDE